MKFLMMIYVDDALLQALPEDEFDTWMRGCLAHADGLRQSGCVLDSQQLEPPSTARSFRERQQRRTIIDGPFAETKEYLAGFNLIEAADLDEALRIAQQFPWARIGAIEVRPVRDMDAVRRRVGD